MVTLKQIEQVAKQGFISELESRGFTYFPTLYFARIRGEDIYNVIIFERTKGGHLKVFITCWTPEFCPDDVDTFPRSVSLEIGGFLTEKGIERISEMWELSNLDFLMNLILKLIDKYAIPWFDSIKTRQDYIDELFDDVKEQCSPELFDLVLKPSKSYGFPPKNMK